MAVSPKENFASGLVIRECTVEIDSSEWIPMHAVIEGRYDATDFLLSLSLQNCDQNSLLSADDFIFKKDLKTSEMRMRKKELWKFLKTALATYPAEFPEKGDGAGEPDPGD